MSVSTQVWTEQASPTNTYSVQSSTSVTYSDLTSSSPTLTEIEPELEGTLFGAGLYDANFYEARTYIIGRVD